MIPVAARNSTLRFGHNASRVRLLGTSADYTRVRRFATVRGRFLTSEDESQRMIVLGDAVSRELDPKGVRPGDAVWLAGQPYEVAGVLGLASLVPAFMAGRVEPAAALRL